jgi:hypothetical protein
MDDLRVPPWIGNLHMVDYYKMNHDVRWVLTAFWWVCVFSFKEKKSNSPKKLVKESNQPLWADTGTENRGPGGQKIDATATDARSWKLVKVKVLSYVYLESETVHLSFNGSKLHRVNITPSARAWV